MNDKQKKANLEHAQQVLSKAVTKAMKDIAEDTGATEVHVLLQLGFSAQLGICAGGAQLCLVYPQEQQAPADPEGATKLVDELLKRLKSSRGN